MRSELLVILAAPMLVVIACSSLPTTVTAPTQPVAVLDRDHTLITLERFPCLGRCPKYQLGLDGNGRVVYNGQQNVSVYGIHEKIIDRAKVDELLRLFDESGYFSLQDYYGWKTRDLCHQYWTDADGVVTSVEWNGRSKKVSHDHGCILPELERLKGLENLIDAAAAIEEWTKVPPEESQ